MRIVVFGANGATGRLLVAEALVRGDKVVAVTRRPDDFPVKDARVEVVRADVSHADIHERKFWSQYQKVYGECLNATSTKTSPWYVVPADDKDNARLIVSRIVIDALSGLHARYPKTTHARRRELQAIRKHLER